MRPDRCGAGDEKLVGFVISEVLNYLLTPILPQNAGAGRKSHDLSILGLCLSLPRKVAERRSMYAGLERTLRAQVLVLNLFLP